MLLRFDQDFHDCYIRGTFLHHTFESVDYMQVASLLRQYTPDPEHRSTLLEILQSRSPTDAYYKAQYRATDYHVTRRLRVIGPEVEVLLPWDLRQQMTLDIQQTWSRYR